MRRSLVFGGVFGLSINHYWLGKENLEQFRSHANTHVENGVCYQKKSGLEMMRRVKEVFSRGRSICFLFLLLLFALPVTPVAFTIPVCLAYSGAASLVPNA